MCDKHRSETPMVKEHPKRFLKGFKGYLHVDVYSGYN